MFPELIVLPGGVIGNHCLFGVFTSLPGCIRIGQDDSGCTFEMHDRRKTVSGTIAENIAQVQERIRGACRLSGRDPASVRLIAVSKTVPPRRIREAAAGGAGLFGENYIQEAREKIAALAGTASWHFIGRLQSNKAKYAVELFDMIHSVDSLHLAESISKAAQKRGRVMPVLMQVNISGEESKSGIHPGTTAGLLLETARLPGLSVRGLMTMPPLSGSPEDSRPYFRALRRLRDTLVEESAGRFSLAELSMGMSGDFEVAVEEGATLVRVGTAIFGARG